MRSRLQAAVAAKTSVAALCFALCMITGSARAGVVDVTRPPYNATGNGVTDDTMAINNAIATGSTVYLPVPSNCYKTTTDLVMATKGQIMYGDGRTRSKICPSGTAFAKGVITFTSGEVGPQLRDFGIVFTQPTTSLPAQMTRYVPAIYAENTPRFRIEHFRISLAWNGIDMRGNSGGALIDDLEISAFNFGIWIDGSEDSVRLNNVHSWPFDLNSTQIQAFFDPSVTSFYIGRCDDCKILGGMSIAGTAMNFFTGATGSVTGSVSDFAFDTNNGVVMSSGTVNMANVYFTPFGSGSTSATAIFMTGGALNVASFWAQAGTASTPMIQITSVSTSDATSLNMSDGKIILGNNAGAVFLNTANNGGMGRIGLTNNFFDATPDVRHTMPLIYIDRNFRLQAIGNQMSDKGTGSGTFWRRVSTSRGRLTRPP